MNQEQVLYKILNIPPDSSFEDIRKSYKKLALKFHPDKNTSNEAVENFQKIKEAYEILNDPEKRKIYDRTGNIEELSENSISSFIKAYQFYRELFPAITLSQIDEYKKKYQNSKEEKEDLINFFIEKKGNIKKILSEIPMAKNKDIKRFVLFYEELIKDQQYQQYLDQFNKTKNKIILLKEKKINLQEEILSKAISIKQSKQNYLDYLEEKYSKNDKPIIKQKKRKKVIKKKNQIIYQNQFYQDYSLKDSKGNILHQL